MRKPTTLSLDAPGGPIEVFWAKNLVSLLDSERVLVIFAVALKIGVHLDSFDRQGPYSFCMPLACILLRCHRDHRNVRPETASEKTHFIGPH